MPMLFNNLNGFVLLILAKKSKTKKQLPVKGKGLSPNTATTLFHKMPSQNHSLSKKPTLTRKQSNAVATETKKKEKERKPKTVSTKKSALKKSASQIKGNAGYLHYLIRTKLIIVIKYTQLF